MNIETPVLAVPGPSISRRRAFALVGAAAGYLGAALPAAPAATAAFGAARRRRKPKVVTRTFFNDTPMVFEGEGAASPYPTSLTVRGLANAKILDLNLTLIGLTHGDVADLDFMLEAPTGRRAIVMSDVGAGASIADQTIIIDDEAPRLFPQAGPLTAGRYRPRNIGPEDPFPPFGSLTARNVKLSVFDGLDPSGEWQLYATDDTAGQAGQLLDWSLRIRAKIRR